MTHVIDVSGYPLFSNSASCSSTKSLTPFVAVGSIALIFDSMFQSIFIFGSTQRANAKTSACVLILVFATVSWSATEGSDGGTETRERSYGNHINALNRNLMFLFELR